MDFSIFSGQSHRRRLECDCKAAKKSFQYQSFNSQHKSLWQAAQFARYRMNVSGPFKRVVNFCHLLWWISYYETSQARARDARYNFYKSVSISAKCLYLSVWSLEGTGIRKILKTRGLNKRNADRKYDSANTAFNLLHQRTTHEKEEMIYVDKISQSAILCVYIT